jgi:hypothetical protein
VQERAVRLVFEQQPEHPSQWSAIESIAPKIGCKPETLRKWVRRAERDAGTRPGLTTNEHWRSSTADRSDGDVHRRAPGDVWGRADLRSPADRPSEPLGYVPPLEFEATYYNRHDPAEVAGRT